MKAEAAEDNLYQYLERDINVAGYFHLTQVHVKTTAFRFPGKGIIDSRTGIPHLKWLGLLYILAHIGMKKEKEKVKKGRNKLTLIKVIGRVRREKRKGCGKSMRLLRVK